MPMKRCDNGHYFDETKHSSCPSCGVPDLDIQKTQAFKPQQAAFEDDGEPKTRPAAKRRQAPSDDGVTVAISKKKMGLDPVVGWLVCIEGADKGRDYRIHSERNFIGRSSAMDISIQGDDAISRENHAIVSFNPKNSKLKLGAGDSRGLVYLNDDDIDVPAVLNAYDIIELGQTKLMFVPLCNEQFQWKADEPA